jgi:hypothetical protein
VAAVGAVALAVTVAREMREDGVPMVVIAIVVLALVAFGVGALWAVAVDRLTIDGEHLEVRQLGSGVRRVRRSDVRGFRTLATHGVTTLALELHAGKPIKIGIVYALDDVFAGWMRGIPDQDALDHQASLDELARDRTIAATPADAVAKLELAHRVARGLDAAALGLLVWGFVHPWPHALFVGASVALPWIAIVVLHLGGGLFAVDGKPGQSVKPIVILSLVSPGALLMLRGTTDYTLLDPLSMAAAAPLGGIAMAIATAVASRTHAKGLIAVHACLFAAYGWGVAVHANALLERSAPETFDVAVLDRGAFGRVRVRGNLRIGPWGPIGEPTWQNVSLATYDAAVGTGTVHVTLHEGALGARWYAVGPED